MYRTVKEVAAALDIAMGYGDLTVRRANLEDVAAGVPPTQIAVWHTWNNVTVVATFWRLPAEQAFVDELARTLFDARLDYRGWILMQPSDFNDQPDD